MKLEDVMPESSNGTSPLFRHGVMSGVMSAEKISITLRISGSTPAETTTERINTHIEIQYNKVKFVTEV